LFTRSMILISSNWEIWLPSDSALGRSSPWSAFGASDSWSRA
jgi:hypothetical protein